MGKPDDIPQDVWDAAGDIIVNHGNRTGTLVVSLQAPIARAIDAAILSAKAEGRAEGKAEQREADAFRIDAASAAERELAKTRVGGGPEFRASMLDDLASAIRAGV